MRRLRRLLGPRRVRRMIDAGTQLRELFGAPPAPAAVPELMVVRADEDPRLRAAYDALRHRVFVHEQGRFAGHDRDEHDEPGTPTRLLVAVGLDGEVAGGVRLHPEGPDPGLGWWRGSRLVCRDDGSPGRGRVGATLVRAACASAHDAGALRFDAHVQPQHVRFFRRLGWSAVRPLAGPGGAHHLMRWDVRRPADLAEGCKAPLAGLVGDLLRAGAGGGAFLGDDAVPVPGSDLVVASDAILPVMVDRDPEWAGWCAMLVTAHDLAAMGAAPVGVLDALGARDAAHAARVLAGVRAGVDAFALPVLGGHTQLGVTGALSMTGLGRTADPVAAGGGRAGDVLTLTADLRGEWRPGYGRRQWDSSSSRAREELAAMLGAVARARPRAAKDVSMAGIAGTAGMLAEASGCAAEIDVAAVLRPRDADAGDWLTCFPGFAMLTADRAGAPPLPAGPATGAPCGRLVPGAGVRLRWPDGEITVAVPAGVTGLGAALPSEDPTSTPTLRNPA